ncbi:uncharacterized protein LOC127866674 [Dreissena polymorpha]|uniref:Uncharacterized protein n=1 Tax=Dreissena polymorpha TaxID=45954 RepID=A0A9D4RCZ0_DREPO|nr:uncharacterized protein LOC127866674 [Dreissena polymorpha]KAH3863851.1 hypothetical protein DPMN_026854 [Dreissena polymorpha]
MPGAGPSSATNPSQRPTSFSGLELGGHTSVNTPDVTADIIDIYEASHSETSTNASVSDGVSVAPDYPMDSLPRHTSTHSLPGTGVQRERREAPAPPRSHSSNVAMSNVVVASQGAERGLTHLPPSSLSTSAGNIASPVIPVLHSPSRPPVITHIPMHSLPHAHLGAASSPAVVSPSNINVHVSGEGIVSIPSPVSVNGLGNSRSVVPPNFNTGVVRMDRHSSSGNMLPDVVSHSQQALSPRPTHASPRPTRPNIPQSESRHSELRDHRHSSEPHGRHRHTHGHRHRSHRHSRHQNLSEEEPCKESCMKCLAAGTSFRWILVVLSLLGVCCVVTGIVLAALHAAGNSFLFLAIMFLGLGVLLVVVVGVGWKCTPRGHEPLHALFHLGEFRRHSRRRRTRTHERRRGGNRWYGGSMYPEFQYRRPPPSYNASMQEFQQQQHQQPASPHTPDLYDPNSDPNSDPAEDYSLPSSPPPSYRSRASTVRAGIQITFPPNQGGDFPDSRPPTYRSHPSNTLHTRHTRPSLSRDDDDLYDHDPAPADVAFTGSTVFVDTNNSQCGTSIHINPVMAANQNVTVSVTTVSVTTSAPVVTPHVHAEGAGSSALPSDSFGTEIVDPVGEGGLDREVTQL